MKTAGGARWRSSGPAVALASALAYALVGALALLLAGPPGYAAPVYPSAGIALAAVLGYGRGAIPGVWIGATAVNIGLALAFGHSGLGAVLVPAVIGLGAALQAALGAALVRRHVAQPVVLNAPRDVLRFCLLGAGAACLVSPTIATAALLASGAIGRDTGITNWITWWAGDAAGVIIGAPLTWTLIGRPRADWLPRRRTVGLPLLAALALLMVGVHEFGRLDGQRQAATFGRDVDRLAAEAQARLREPMDALQALNSSALARGGSIDQASLQAASRWWLEQPIELQATGYAERVALPELAAFEAQARADGAAGYHVFDRDGGVARGRDGEVVAVRYIEPLAGNAGALGVNSLSVPAARKAIEAARDSGAPVATAGFMLSQGGDGTGIVIYQALYRGTPTDLAERRRSFTGVVFVTLRAAQVLSNLAGPSAPYLHWCLEDPSADGPQRRLAGTAACELPRGIGHFEARRLVELGGRQTRLRVSAAVTELPGQDSDVTWLIELAALAAAAMLGAMLLTVTGLNRRTELAVESATTELRREVSERSAAEAALRASETRLRTLLDHVPLGVAFMDAEGRVIEFNHRLCEIVALDAEALHGRPLTDLFQADQAGALNELRRRLIEEPSRSLLAQLPLRGAQAPQRIARITATALQQDGGRSLRMVGVLDDITERLRLEASERALHRAEAANLAKSEFLSRMSHELRTPLNAMMGFAQLLGMDREPGLAPHQRDWVDQVQRAGWHLLELINETLDLARIESGNVQLTLAPVALAPLVAACREMVGAGAQARGISVSSAFDEDAGAVVADATRLQQVLTNLLSNGVKYNRDGGQLAVTAQRIPRADGDLIEIAVSDSGLGMTESQLAALFQPYNRLGREASGIEGTGIGLVISRRLAELMGGTLEAASEAGVGSVFTLRLPAVEAAEAPSARYSLSSPAPYRERRVHYVEDNETNIEVMRGVFAQRPQVQLTTSMLGLDGLAAIRADHPDLILLDMQLPDISGIELLRHLKQDERLAGIPVVVVSADATSAHMRQALVAGALHYVTKPLNVAQFFEIVDAILEEAQTRWG
ncbi:MAG: CHASE domain-containing protein [Burkholderiales bacterium]|nr:CHASE domain-containing protein [Burkholderiales bacterium]